jgi:short-subunit dehydrogenase
VTTLAGACAVVTGGSSGIGLATAQLLRARGAEVCLLAHDRARLEAAAREVGADPLSADLGDSDDTERAAARLVDLRPDVVVHCAGVGLQQAPDRTRPEELRRLLEVNLVAATTLTAAVLPAMEARGTGHLVFVTSVAGRLGVGDEPAYSATKAALDAYATSVAAHCRPRGIRVTTVVPGVVDTAFFTRRGAPYARRFPRPVPAALVAARLVAGVEHDRTEVVVPRWLRAAMWVRTIAPGAYAAGAARWG